MLVVVKGAGDLASGVAVRLHRAGIDVVMTDLERPTAIRREVSFCRAISQGEARVEDVGARRAYSPEQALALTREGWVAVLVDPQAACVAALKPDAVVDAILAKRNTGTKRGDAPAVVALGPGFAAGEDCDAVVETMRGHDLGRVYLTGSALPNTGVPGEVGGQTILRLLRASADGTFREAKHIGDFVRAGEAVAYVDGAPVTAGLDGVIRGLLPTGTPVDGGMKCGDIDPRGVRESCYTVSDKARAIGGGVLEALLALWGTLRETSGI